jgi:hypothetical protein
MPSRSLLAGFAAGAVFAVVVGGGTAIAANGKPSLLGRSNQATSTTGFTNPNGPALGMRSKAGTAPFAVSSDVKVNKLNADLLDGVDSSRLNADRLDGLDSSQLARTAATTGSRDALGALSDLDQDQQADSIVATATCPAGTQLTGGGATDFTSTGYVVSSAPDAGGKEAWVVVVGIDENATEAGSDVTATAVCYDPRGTVGAGAYRQSAKTDPTKAVGDLSQPLREKLRTVAERQ